MKCEYPTCTKEAVNEDNLCEEHTPEYPKKSKVFNLKRIQEGLKRMSLKAPKYIKPAFEELKEEDVQEVLFKKEDL